MTDSGRSTPELGKQLAAIGNRTADCATLGSEGYSSVQGERPGAPWLVKCDAEAQPIQQSPTDLPFVSPSSGMIKNGTVLQSCALGATVSY